jgi:hypothetical protein
MEEQFNLCKRHTKSNVELKKIVTNEIYLKQQKKEKKHTISSIKTRFEGK